jgi:hypothetical protein
MDLKDVVSLVSLVSTLAMLFYMAGTLKGQYASKDALSTLEREMRLLIASKERESLNAHTGFVPRQEFEKFEERSEKKWEQIEAKIDIVQSSVSRLLALWNDKPRNNNG